MWFPSESVRLLRLPSWFYWWLASSEGVGPERLPSSRNRVIKRWKKKTVAGFILCKPHWIIPQDVFGECGVIPQRPICIDIDIYIYIYIVYIYIYIYQYTVLATASTKMRDLGFKDCLSILEDLPAQTNGGFSCTKLWYKKLCMKTGYL